MSSRKKHDLSLYDVEMNPRNKFSRCPLLYRFVLLSLQSPLWNVHLDCFSKYEPGAGSCVGEERSMGVLGDWTSRFWSNIRLGGSNLDIFCSGAGQKRIENTRYKLRHGGPHNWPKWRSMWWKVWLSLRDNRLQELLMLYYVTHCIAMHWSKVIPGDAHCVGILTYTSRTGQPRVR